MAASAMPALGQQWRPRFLRNCPIIKLDRQLKKPARHFGVQNPAG